MDNIKVVFTGQFLEGHDEASAREQFAAGFGVAEDTLDSIFSGGEFTLKQNLDSQTASKLQRVLNHFGMDVRLEGIESVPAVDLSAFVDDDAEQVDDEADQVDQEPMAEADWSSDEGEQLSGDWDADPLPVAASDESAEPVAVGLDELEAEPALEPLDELGDLSDDAAAPDLDELDELSLEDAEPSSDFTDGGLTLEPLENEVPAADPDAPVEFSIDDPTAEVAAPSEAQPVDEAEVDAADDGELSLEAIDGEEPAEPAEDLAFLEDLDFGGDQQTHAAGDSAAAALLSDGPATQDDALELLLDDDATADLAEAEAAADRDVEALAQVESSDTDDGVICGKCGHSQAAAAECAKCGAALAVPDEAVLALEPVSGKSGKRWGLIGGGVVALAGLAYAGYEYVLPQLQGSGANSASDVRARLKTECSGEAERANCELLLEQRWDGCVADSTLGVAGAASMDQQQATNFYNEVNYCIYREFFETQQFAPDQG